MSNCDRKYIYRYMNYNEFLDILRFNRLTLRYPGQWPDKLEMLFLKCFENETELNRLSSTYQNKLPNYSVFDVKSDFQILSAILIKTRCQCWTYKEDDLVMWNERNSNEAVRICINKASLDKYEKACDEGRIIHRDISYHSEVSCETLLKSFAKNRKIPQFVLIKKDVFSYEDEHRVVFLPPNHFFHTASYGYTLSECLQRHFYGIKGEFGTLDRHLSFDINDIEDVKVNPNASGAFTDLVKSDCACFGLKYSGISQILF